MDAKDHGQLLLRFCRPTAAITIVTLLWPKPTWAAGTKSSIPTSLGGTQAVESVCHPFNRLSFLRRLHGEALDQVHGRRVRCEDRQAIAKPVTAMGDEWHNGFAR